MAENSKIEWTTHTFNPWRGCTKVSPGCKNCYADTLSKRNPLTLGVWGSNGTRVVAAEAAWKDPVKWNKQAACTCGWNDGGHAWDCPQADERPRVFCASLADVFEDWTGPMVRSDGYELSICHECSEWMFYTQQGCKPGCKCQRAPRPLTMADVRARLFELIDATPNLDWLLLTKRPENIRKMMPDYQPGGKLDAIYKGLAVTRPNLWLGTSVEDAKTLPRIDWLKGNPAAIHFLSIEPLLGPLPTLGEYLDGIDWVIVGGESGPGARPCNVAWVRSIVEQCKAAGVACFVKQLGAFIVDRNDAGFDATAETFADGPNEGMPTDPRAWPDMPDLVEDLDGTRDGYQGAPVRVLLRDKKGGDMAEWPVDLRVREFPQSQPKHLGAL